MIRSNVAKELPHSLIVFRLSQIGSGTSRPAAAPRTPAHANVADAEMGLSNFIGWPRALNGIGDDMHLTGDGPKPVKEQWIQDALAGTSE